MQKLMLILIISLSAMKGHAQDLRVIKYHELEKVLKSSPEKPKVVNFWATWCGPCVKEMPYFTAAQLELKDRNLEFIYVSLDFMSQTPKVKEMIKKLELSGTLIQLDEPGGDWIDAFDKNWSGAIPYTVLVLPNGEQREHYDAFDSFNDLKLFLDNNLTN